MENNSIPYEIKKSQLDEIYKQDFIRVKGQQKRLFYSSLLALLFCLGLFLGFDTAHNLHGLGWWSLILFIAAIISIRRILNCIVILGRMNQISDFNSMYKLKAWYGRCTIKFDKKILDYRRDGKKKVQYEWTYLKAVSEYENYLRLEWSEKFVLREWEKMGAILIAKQALSADDYEFLRAKIEEFRPKVPLGDKIAYYRKL